MEVSKLELLIMTGIRSEGLSYVLMWQHSGVSRSLFIVAGLSFDIDNLMPLLYIIV